MRQFMPVFFLFEVFGLGDGHIPTFCFLRQALTLSIQLRHVGKEQIYYSL